mmetsp:Transcript_23048/g.55567  ORF Transcript_23048/g.55567 Transcript_23048/m.55567 type:complete len:407 (+) Transcript_23048:290-1510(+)
MGDFLRDSSTTKTTYAATFDSLESHDEGIVHFAVSSMRGRRNTQEDAYVVETELRAYNILQNSFHDVLPGHALFAVFDGHGTSFASNYASMHFAPTFCKQASFVEYSKQCLLDQPQQAKDAKKKFITESQKKSRSFMYNNDSFAKDKTGELRMLLEDAIKTTMIELDSNLFEEMTVRNDHIKKNLASPDKREEVYEEFDSGTTAIVVILTPTYIVSANLGDSRAILQRDGQHAVSLSYDHKPYNELEELRIRNAGGVVISGNVEGRLAVSRGLGDFDFKHTPSVLAAAGNHNDNAKTFAYVQPENQMVSPVPDITVLRRQSSRDKFLAIACDGIWDVVTNERCAEIICTVLNEGEQNLALVCEEVLDQCYAKGSLDNMTAILVKFWPQEIGSGGGVMKRRKQRGKK